MKKILILTMVLIVSISSVFFRGCLESEADYPYGLLGIFVNMMDGTYNAPGDYLTSEHYVIYVGENGGIGRSSGDDNFIFERKISGTTQNLNYVRIAPSTTAGIALTVGDNGTILLSTNKGNNWSVSATITTANLNGADLRSGGYYYAVGDNGTFLVSATNGNIWNLVPCGTTRNLKAISLSNQFVSNVVVIGEKGTIIRSTNSGINWTNVSIADTTVNFYDISKKGLYYTTGNNFCVVGSGGRIYKSTDGGATWVQKQSGTTNTLRSIYQYTVDSIAVAGDNGTMRFSVNGGETWFTDSYFNFPTGRNIKSVILVNRDHYTFSALSDSLFFVSKDPFIIGLQPVSSEVPNAFSLSQNYPNPFNPNTKIKFDISKSGFAKLIMFDISGREVETLVNEQLKTGTYEVNFDGSKYSSGVYFYVLKTESFTESKKMILIK